jgi:transglutaminase-like putative cysteine protease
MWKRNFLPMALLLPIVFGMTPKKAASPSAEPKTRVFEFTYKTQVSATANAKELRLWLPYPTTDGHQEIYDMQLVSPVAATVYKEPKYRNSILFVSVPNPGSGPITVEMRFKVRRTEYQGSDLAELKPASTGRLDPEIADLLKPDRLVPLNARVKALAAEVTKGKKTDMEKARAIYDYTLANMKYDKSGEGWGHGDIIYACDAKHGNCTDFHALFIGLCRSSGIPARFSIGFPLPDKRGEADIAGYHCWAEFYLRGHGWVPVDASEAWKHPEKREYFFGNHDENRVQFSTGRDIVLRPNQAGQPLNYFVYPYAEVDGKPVQAQDVKSQFHFKDLEGENSAAAR